MQGVARLRVSDLVSSFQAKLMFRLIQAHLSRSVPRLVRSLDKLDFHLLALVVALAAYWIERLLERAEIFRKSIKGCVRASAEQQGRQ